MKEEKAGDHNPTRSTARSFWRKRRGWWSRPIADVARELGVNETSLGSWVRAYRHKHDGAEPPLQLSERARLRELERRTRDLAARAAAA